MSKRPQLIVYTLEHCPNCETLKGFLSKSGIRFAERDMSTAESLTELRINGIFVNEAPVLQKEDMFLTPAELFSAGAINEGRISQLIAGA